MYIYTYTYYIHVLWDMQKKSNYNTYTKFEYRIIIPFQNSLPGISDYLGVMLISTCPHHPHHHCPTTDLHVSTQPLQRWDSTGTKAMIGEYWERLRKNSCSYTIFFWRGAWFIPSIVGKWTCQCEILDKQVIDQTKITNLKAFINELRIPWTTEDSS